ncbi:MAG TPA: 3-phosphoshikimate 1-carboxyvinyltransferase, partial [Burkholderiales bacterium]|nr:3-phosphoshikimate 1-carboxyvinyltransferase [Burkholderiales bacterium]
MSGGGARPAHLDLAPAVRAAGTVRLPGSKSISNRALLLAALSRGETSLRGVLESDDTARMLDALCTLGVAWTRTGTGEYTVQGADGAFPVRAAELFLGNAGTAFRPLTAALALAGGTYRLSGVPRMHERPIGDLVDALRALGADVGYLGRDGYPPLEIRPAGALGDAATVRGDVSSQFLSALLMALPLAGQRVAVQVAGELVSKPYVEITLDLMRRFGVVLERDGWQRFAVPAAAAYRSPGRLDVEGDASSASYFLAAGAVGGGPVRVEGVDASSIQGDVRFVEVLRAMGADVTFGTGWIEVRGRAPLRPIDLDLNHIPDAAMTAAVLALFADGPSTIRNVANWRVKETDRLA